MVWHGPDYMKGITFNPGFDPPNPYWFVFIILTSLKHSDKQMTLDDLRSPKSPMNRSGTRKFLEWLRRKGYVREIVKDDISYFSCTLTGERMVNQYEEKIKSFNKEQKEKLLRNAFLKIKPPPIKQYYLIYGVLLLIK